MLMTLLLASLGTLTSAIASRTWQSAVGTFVISIGVLFLTGMVIDGSGGPDSNDAFGTFWRLIIGEPDGYPYGLVRLFFVTIAVAAVRHFVVIVDTPTEGSRLRLLVPLLIFFLVTYSIFIWGMFANMRGSLVAIFFFMFLLMSILAVVGRVFLGGTGQADLASDVFLIIVFGLLLVTVALDIDERPFRYVGGYSSGVVSIGYDLLILALRELWLVIIVLSTLVGLALIWLPVLASIAVLGTMELLGLTSWLTKVLGTPGNVGAVLPLAIGMVAFTLGIYNIMTEMGSRRLIIGTRHHVKEVAMEDPWGSALEGETP